MQLLGLDFVSDSGLATQVESFIDFFQNSLPSQAQFGGVFLAWLIAKVPIISLQFHFCRYA